MYASTDAGRPAGRDRSTDRNTHTHTPWFLGLDDAQDTQTQTLMQH